MVTKRLKTDARQVQIAEAALDIVRTYGVRALNVAALAEKVNLVPSAVYRHFKNKGEILEAVLHLIQTRLNQLYQDIVHQDIEPIEKLNLMFRRHIDLIGSNNAIPRIIFSEEVSGGSSEKRAQLYAIVSDVIKYVAAVVAEGQEDGAIRSDVPAEDIAVSFLGMIQPAAIIWNLSDGEFDLIHNSQSAWKLFSNAIKRG